MLSVIFIYTAYLLFGFGAMYYLFAPKIKLFEKTLDISVSMLPFLYIWGFTALGMISGYFISNNYDFVDSLTWTRILIPLGLSMVIYFAYIFLRPMLYRILIGVCVAVIIWLQHIESVSSLPGLPVWAIQLIIFVCATGFCLIAPVLNGVPHTFIVPSVAILFGLSVMSIIGAAPGYFAYCAAMIIGCLAAYLYLNFYTVKIEFDNPTCCATAFLICNLLVMNSGEYGIMSCFVLTLIFWVEFIAALWRRYFVTSSGHLFENTNYYWLATQTSAQMTVASILKICVVAMFLAWFQLFSVNEYSLSIVAFVIIYWLNGSIGNSPKKSLKQINKEFVENLKQEIEATKKALQKKDKK